MSWQGTGSQQSQTPSRYLGALHAVLLAAGHLVLLLPAQQLFLHNLPQGHSCPNLQGVQPRHGPGSIQEVQQAQKAQLAVDDVNGCDGQLQHGGLLGPLGRTLVAEDNEGLISLTLKGGLGGGLGGSRGAGDDPWGQLVKHGLIIGAGGWGGHQGPRSCHGPQIEANGCCIMLQVAVGD